MEAIFVVTGLVSVFGILAVVLPSAPRYDHDEILRRLEQAQTDLENL
jgi:hypothetical protein